MGERELSQDNAKRTAYKTKRRIREFELIVSAIRQAIPRPRQDTLRILEFGAGPGAGSHLLSQLGSVVVSDICVHPLLDLPDDVEFRQVDIHHTDFDDSEFDLLVSNQVIEHLDRLDVAFAEMKRIAKPEAYFVFAVPTATWLLLSVPGQLFKKAENLLARLGRSEPRTVHDTDAREGPTASEPDVGSREPANRSMLARFALRGHGCYPAFLQCYRFFRVGNWRRTLHRHGFEIVDSQPLLTYGSSHLPIIRMNRPLARLGLASSYLFICRLSPPENRSD